MNIFLRRVPLSLRASSLSTQLPRPFLTNHCITSLYCRSYTVTMVSNKDKDQSKHNNKNGTEHVEKEHAGAADEAHQFQAGATTHRKEDEWKHRAPYKVHSDDENFDVKWKGGCHCGKVQYQLSREAPLATKFCHCSTCQRLHGVSWKSDTWCTLC